MLAQYLWKRRKILRGWRATRSAPQREYDAGRWWDDAFYSGQITDRNTISRGRSLIAAALHYASVETIILRHLPRSPERVIDIGSGAGHWLDFYTMLGAEVAGCDVSAKCVEYLRQRFDAVEHGPALAALPALGVADLVNAIGVMFHIVDDAEWQATIRAVSDCLRPGGLFVVGGHFGWLDGVNVQWDGGTVNKRLRSARRWRSVLHAAGFDRVRIARNYAYLHASEPLPENNILFAVKRS